MEDARVFFPEGTVLKLRIRYCLAVLSVFISIVDAVEAFRVLNDDIEPDVWLDLAEDMRVRAGRYTLNWRLHLWERLKEVYDAFTNANLFALFMDVHRAWVKEQDLDVREIFLWGFVGTSGH